MTMLVSERVTLTFKYKDGVLVPVGLQTISAELDGSIVSLFIGTKKLSSVTLQSAPRRGDCVTIALPVAK